MTRIHSDIQTIGELKDLPMIAPALPQKFTFDWPETQTMNVVADFAGKKYSQRRQSGLTALPEECFLRSQNRFHS